MIPVIFTITYTGWVAELMQSSSVRVSRRVTRAGFRAMAEHWVSRMLRTHFTPHAHHEYPDVYRPRAAKYRRWKRRTVGHNKPLVLSGVSEQMAKSGARIRATWRSARISLPVPVYFKLRPPGSQVDKVAELKAVSPGEILKLAAVCKQAIIAEILRMRGGRHQLVIGSAA